MSNLFKDEETKDKSVTAINDKDTRIQRMSKLFARRTFLIGDPVIIMISYQKGAQDMKPLVLKELCKDCPSKKDCNDLDTYMDCESYNNISKLFDL